MIQRWMTRKSAVIAAMLLSAWNMGMRAQAPLETLLVGVDKRPAQSLNGPWHYLVEQPPDAQLYDSKGNIRDDGYAQNTHPNITGGRHNGEYDFATAPTLMVPGDWNTQDPTLFRFEGVVWYERDFHFKPTPHTRTFFHVGAANYLSVVWINGKRLCSHEGGFTPYDCDATGLLRDGENSVVVAVDSTRHVDDIPSLSYDFFDYGGITRDVSLVTVPDRFIDDYDVHLEHPETFVAGSKAARTLTGYVHVQNATTGMPVTIDVPEARVSATVRTDDQGVASFTLPAQELSLWSPKTPRLYAVHLSAGNDSLTDEIGFRDVRVDGTRIMLNGVPIALLGANVHAEAPVRGGEVNSDLDVQRIYAMLHDIHANFARLCHYPQDQRMTRESDREGILIWSEIPIWQRMAFEDPIVYRKALYMLHEMIRRDRDKASVILWSVSNETPNTPVRTRFLTDLANVARKDDPTRLITSALITPRVDQDRIVQDDPLMAALDVVGQNDYIGWYDGKASDADRKTWILPQKPFIFSEFGAEAKFGVHGPVDERWGEEQQVDVLRHQFNMIRNIPQARGVSPWVLMDFRSPVRNVPKLQDGYNRKGLFSEKGEKKESVAYVRDAYTDNPPVKAQ